jgi:hypothetical protein
MNAYIFDTYIMHSIMLEHKEEEGTFTTYLDLVEIGPLSMPDSSNMNRIKDIVRDISSTPVTSNWWTEFSTWEDFHGLLRSGTKLSMHSIVSKINKQLQLLENNVSYVDLINENGNLIIEHDETFPTVSQGFKITAKRKRLRTLKEIAAYNVTKCITSESDVQNLEIPHSLHSMVTMFLDTYSGDYRTA